MMTESNSIELKYLEVYGYCDPAAGKEARDKKRSCRQAIVVAGRDWLSRWFVLYSWAGKITTTELKKKILDVYEQYRPRQFGIESNGMQVLFGSLVRDEAKQRDTSIKIIPLAQPTNVEKKFRIRTGLEPIINSGRLFLSQEAIDLEVEIKGFPTAQFKDLVDALETCIRMAPKRAIQSQKNDQLEQYAQYLRNSRLPSYLIEQKLAEFASSVVQ